MCKTTRIPAWRLGLAALCLLAGRPAGAVSLYDGSLGTSPAVQGWSSVVPAPFATETVAAGAVTLDTTLGNSVQAGYSYFVPMDSAAGFTLSFSVQVAAESHTGNGNRAGFSVIALDGNHQGVELGFWTGQVWAQAVGFTKAESAAHDTTAMATYLLTLHNGAYALSLEGAGAPLLTGALRDYSAFGVPYSLSNFLFMGDDTTSAKARASIAQVSTVSAVPLPAAWVLMLGPALGFLKARRRGGRGAAA